MPIIGALAMGGASLLGSGISAYFGNQANQEQLAAAREAMAAQQAEARRARQYAAQQAGLANQQIQAGTNQAAGALQQGYGTGLGNLGAGYAMAGQALQPLAQLQQYGGTVGQYATSGGRLGELLAGNLTRENAYAGFETDPGYAFRQQQGEQALQRAAAAQGGRASPRTLKSLMQFNQDLASSEYDKFAQRRAQLNALQMQGASAADQSQLGAAMGLANVGYGAQSQLSDLARALGTNQANLNTAQGSALASLYGTAAANQAGNLTGLANQSTQLSGAMLPTYGGAVPYAGAGTAAMGGALAQGIGNIGYLGGMLAMNAGAPGAGMAAPGGGWMPTGQAGVSSRTFGYGGMNP